MSRRQNIEIPGFGHQNPIPVASRIGNLVMSSVTGGPDPVTRQYPAELAKQIVNIFGHIKATIEKAGGTPDDIIKVTFWVKDPATGRGAINDEWVKMFPDPNSRPARHTLQLAGDGPAQITCDFVAVLK